MANHCIHIYCPKCQRLYCARGCNTLIEHPESTRIANEDPVSQVCNVECTYCAHAQTLIIHSKNTLL